MNIFRRDFKKLEDESAQEQEMKIKLEQLRNENIGKSDIFAIIIAMIQIILPFALVIAFIYFILIEFLTKVWLK